MVEQKGIIRKIVFLVYWPITEREVEKWSFSYLASEGFEVIVYDLSPLLNRDALKKSPITTAIKAEYIFELDSFREFEKKVKDIAQAAVFIDFIMGLSEIDLKTERVFRILKKCSATYFVISAGTVPVPAFAENSSQIRKKLINKAQNALNPRILVNFILRKLIVLARQLTDFYAMPAMIFGGNSEVLAAYVRTHGIDRKKIVPIHSLDFDTFLNYTQGSCVRQEPLEGTCVFLDEAATSHSDFILMNLKPIGEEKYFPSMNKLFNIIEERTGLKVVIAAHPRSKYEDIPEVFGGRKIFKGKTVELVDKSSMVITHASTSVSFAILFNKPILFVKTEEMGRHRHYNASIDLMAATLGLQPLNIDSQAEMEHFSFDYTAWPKNKYEDYKFKYVKSGGLADLKVWEIVAQEIHKINRVHKSEADCSIC